MMSSVTTAALFDHGIGTGWTDGTSSGIPAFCTRDRQMPRAAAIEAVTGDGNECRRIMSAACEVREHQKHAQVWHKDAQSMLAGSGRNGVTR